MTNPAPTKQPIYTTTAEDLFFDHVSKWLDEYDAFIASCDHTAQLFDEAVPCQIVDQDAERVYVKTHPTSEVWCMKPEQVEAVQS